MMKAWQITRWGEPLEEREVPVPEPRGTEVLLRVQACGVCHSDIHIWDGYFDLGGGRRARLEDSGMALPFTMGHEPLGEVVALGPDAEGVAVGDLRVVYPWIGCGACDDCARDEELLCPTPAIIGTRQAGGYAEYLVVPHPRYLVAFDGVDPAVAATAACSGITAYSALTKVRGLREEQSLLIIGAGGVGLAAIGMARAVVGARLVVADIDPAKRDAALRAGADHVIDNSDATARRELRSVTGGGPAAAIDFVGAPASVRFGFDGLARGGTLVVVGLFGGSVEISTSMFPLKSVNILGSYVGTRRDLVDVLQLMRAGQITPVPLVRRQLSDAAIALQDLREGKVLGRCVLINY